MTSQRIISFLPQQASQAASIVKDKTPDSVMGYRAGGTPRAVEGDSSFPFFKDPPQTFEPELYLPAQVLVTTDDLTDFTVGPTIDVRGIRELVLYVELVLSSADPIPPDPALNGALSILPEMLFTTSSGEELAWPVGLTDLTLSEDGVPADGYSERNVFQTELIWDPGAGQSPAPTLDGTFRLVLPFDVTAALQFRWRFGCISGAACQVRAFVGAVR